jgi:transcriptional regulator with XRE-family HTH domain
MEETMENKCRVYKAAAILKGIPLQELAESMGASVGYLSRVINGKVPMTEKFEERLIDCLQANTDELKKLFMSFLK